MIRYARRRYYAAAPSTGRFAQTVRRRYFVRFFTGRRPQSRAEA